MENLLLLLPRRPQSLGVRYGTTTVIVLLFFLIRVGLEGRAGTYGFFLLIPAIFLSSVLFDRGAGFYATALSVVLTLLLLDPQLNREIATAHAIALFLFAAVAFGIAAISEALRKALERAVQAEQAKDLLLREMGHRIKNNLQSVASLLLMQARGSKEPEVRTGLESAVGRVYVMAEAHEFLRPDSQHGSVDMHDYLTELLRRLTDVLRGGRAVAVNLHAEHEMLTADRAACVGLIVNELVTNSFKYAFQQEESGHIDVRFRKTGDGFEVMVEDDGRGKPDGAREGFGSKLIRLMVGQMSGTLREERKQPGQRFVVKIPPH